MSDTLPTPPRKNKRFENGPERLLLSFGLFAVVVLSLAPRLISLRLDAQLANDQAQYASLARDVLASGTLSESLTSRSEGRYLPIGYPLLIAASSWATGWDVDDAGALVSLIFGVLTPLLAAILVFFVTRAAPLAIAAGLALALNYPLVFYSCTLYTESVFLFLSLALSGLLFLGLRSRTRRGLAILWLTLGLTLGLAFLVRSAALFLVVVLPLAYLAGTRFLLREQRVPFALPLMLFVLVFSLFVLGNGWRLYRWNGFFSVSPQIAGNLQVGNLLSALDLEVVKLDPSGTQLNVHVKKLDEANALSSLLSDPLGRVRLLVVNLAHNGFALFAGLGGRNAVFGSVILLTLLLFGALVHRGRRAARQERAMPERDRFLEATLAASVTLVVGHLGAYSIFMTWTRYAEQAIPWAIVALALYLRWGTPFVRRAMALPGELSVFLRGNLEVLREQGATTFTAILVLVGLLTFSVERSAVAKRSRGTDRKVILIGEAIGERATERREEPRIVTLNLGIAFYARGFAYSLPFAEERPERLMNYFRHHGINFVFSDSYTGIDGQMAIGVPLYHLLDLFSKVPGSGVTQRYPGPYFELVPERLPTPAESSKGTLVGGALQWELAPGEWLVVVRGDYTPVRAEPLAPCPAEEYLTGAGSALVRESICMVDGRKGTLRTVVKYLWLRTDGAPAALRWRRASESKGARFRFSDLTVLRLKPASGGLYSSSPALPGSG